MAKAKFYDIKDNEGNVIGSVNAVEGSEIAEKYANAVGESGTGRVYKPGDSDMYVPISEAKADVDINPVSGEVTVTGPDWLTSEIVKSESFKKNYIENKTLLGIVNQLRQNPAASFIDPTSGETVTAISMLKQFQDSATEFTKNYGAIIDFKRDTSKKYGVNFSDEDVSIASNFLSKEDYNRSSAVYVPKWALKEADWESMESWDAKNKTVSAQDFFENIYKEGFFEKVGSSLQEGSVSKLKDFLDNNVIKDEDEEVTEARKKDMSEASYSDELARTIQLFNIVNGSRPEATALFNAAQFGASAVSNFMKGAGELGYTLSSWAMDVADAPFKMFADDNGDTVTVANLALNPLYWPAVVLGEAISFIQDGGDIKVFMAELEDDMRKFATGHGGEAYDEKRLEMENYFEEFNEKLGKISGAWAAGEAVGDFLFLAAENIVFLNTAGAAIAKNTGTFLQSAPGIAKFLSIITPASKLPGLIKTISLASNVVSQGLLETFLSDRDLVKKAISSGEFTPELWDKLKSNTFWNTIGELGPEAGSWVARNTTVGKFISQVVNGKIVGNISYVTNTVKGNIFAKLNKQSWEEVVKTVDKEGGRVVANAVKGVEKFNTALYAVRAKAFRTLADLPITKELSEADQQALDEAYRVVFGKRYDATVDREKLAETIDAIMKKKNIEEVSKEAKSLASTIDKNYKNQQKMLNLMANMENQIDALNKGVSVKMSEMNTYAGDRYTDYAEAQNRVSVLESAHPNLTFRDSGILSKETSEYLSFRSQQVAYTNKLRFYDEAANGSKEKAKLLNRYFGGTEQGLKESKEYLEYINESLAKLSSKMGPDLVKAAEKLLPKLADYTAAIDEYMMKRGYYSKEFSELITNLRKSGVWGENGEYYIHTARLFKTEDVQKSVEQLLQNLKNPAAFSVKMLQDAPKRLSPGDTESSFLDPNMVTYGYLFGAASVAQGQEWGRAIHAMSIATQKLNGISSTLEASYAEEYMKTSLGDLKDAFRSVFKTDSSRIFGDAIKDAFTESSPVPSGVTAIRDYRKASETLEKAKLSKKLNEKLLKSNSKELEKGRKAQEKFVKKLYKEAQSKADIKKADIAALVMNSDAAQDTIINRMSKEELSFLLTEVSSEINNPWFNFIGMSARDFREWNDAVPREVSDALRRSIGKQNYDDAALGEMSEALKKSLSSQTYNLTNVQRTVRRNPDIILNLKRIYASTDEVKNALKSSDAYNSIVAQKYEELLLHESNTILKGSETEYRDAVKRIREGISESNKTISKNAKQLEKSKTKFEKVEERALEKETSLKGKISEAESKITESELAMSGGKPTKNDYASFGGDFVLSLNKAYNSLIDNFALSLMDENKDFYRFTSEIVRETGLSQEQAMRYVVLNQFKNMKAKDYISPIVNSSEFKGSFLRSTAGENSRYISADSMKEVATAISNGIKAKADDELALYQALLATERNAGKYVNMTEYWKEIEKNMDDIESFGVSWSEKSERAVFDRTKIIQMVDNEGNVQFHKIDPLFASLANNQPSYNTGGSSDALKDFILNTNAITGTVFRWGTTGFDKASYINQWFRDPLNAFLNGFARPFTDLKVGGPKGAIKAFMQDAMPPLGTRMFGEEVTTIMSKEFINSTFKTSEEGLISEYGQGILDTIRKSLPEGLSGSAAEDAYRRAVVEYAAGKTGMETIPGLGGMTAAEFYRGSEKVKLSDVRRQDYEAYLSQGMTEAQKKAFFRRSSAAREKFDNFFEKTSRGNWREEYLRKAVYARNYKIAIESGMTMQEAKVWATRYALDATTNFNRSFAYANQFIKSIPYLGAAINGQASFWRLAQLNPTGVASYMTFGLIIPYTALISDSLSDPENKKIYMNIPEYEKDDNLVFVYKGSKISIPLPQELSGFVAPFRHMVEKAADANDNSWINLIASDALGISPIDLSGFVELDANDLLMEDEETGLWSHIGRGVEKAASGLMVPAVRSAYMLMSGRDPYTGREIDTSNVYLDEDGNEQIMDYTKSSIAIKLHNTFPDLSASAAQKILQAFFGRSTMSILDGGVSLLFDGVVSPADYFEDTFSQLEKPFSTGSDKNKAHRDWQNAINVAYKKREELVNDAGLTKALSVMRNESFSEEKRQGARATYEQKMDEYAKFVLDIAKGMKEKYPEAYTTTRVAQIVSLLTMPTGITANDTPYYEQLQTDMYYQSRDEAIDTLLRMGYPTDTANNSALGTSYYNSAGEFQFKVYTPYEIQQIQNISYGAPDQFQAMIESTLERAGLKVSDKWDGYYKIEDSDERKKYKQEWNTKVVTVLYPVISRYGVNTVMNSGSTRDLLDDYLFIDNPFKTKEYLYKIFGGEQ